MTQRKSDEQNVHNGSFTLIVLSSLRYHLSRFLLGHYTITDRWLHDSSDNCFDFLWTPKESARKRVSMIANPAISAGVFPGSGTGNQG